MKTNQLFYFLRNNFFLIFLLISFLINGQTGNSSDIGWGEITELKFRGKSVDTVKISIAEPGGIKGDRFVTKGFRIKSGTLLEVPRSTIITLISSNKNKDSIVGQFKEIYSVSKFNENIHAVGKEPGGLSVKEINNDLTGNATASDDGVKRKLRTKLTKFSVEIDTNGVKFELLRGKVSVSERKKVKINEKVKVDSINQRILYITETTDLNIKNSKYPKISEGIEKNITLESESEIKNFFNKQIKKEKKLLNNSGLSTKSAFKLMSQGNDSLAILNFKKAIDEGEIDRTRIIEASLIIAEGNFINDKLEKTNPWLEIGMEFSKIENDIIQEKYNYFTSIDNDAARSFGLQLITAKEYNAWAYTVKLKLTGCLESPKENPTKWKKEVEQLHKEIEKY